jgi:hypothetical protein
MTGPAVALVEHLCVAPVDLLHSSREIGLAHLDYEVEMVRHEARRVKRPPAPARDAKDEAQKDAAVGKLHEDRQPVVAARGHVVDAVRYDVSERSGHGEDGSHRDATI